MNEKIEDLIAEARRLENNYGDNYEVMMHMSALADALEATASERATVPDAATELATIKSRADEVGEDEGWHIGGAWGDYGEVVVPLRILSYVVDGALDEKIVSTDPGYAATYAEQVARADRAEAERDAALAAIERVRALHRNTGPSQGYDSRFRGGYGMLGDCCGECGSHGEYGVEWPCPTIRAIEAALGGEGE